MTKWFTVLPVLSIAAVALALYPNTATLDAKLQSARSWVDTRWSHLHPFRSVTNTTEGTSEVGPSSFHMHWSCMFHTTQTAVQCRPTIPALSLQGCQHTAQQAMRRAMQHQQEECVSFLALCKIAVRLRQGLHAECFCTLLPLALTSDAANCRL